MKRKAGWLGLVFVAATFGYAQNSDVPQSGNSAQGSSQSATGNPAQKAVVLNPAAPVHDTASEAEDIASLLAPGPLPPNPKLALIGGTVVTLDRIRNRMEVKPFGGRKMRIDFDERSRIFRDGTETTSLGINKGDRIYLDTMLNGAQVFAKTIHVESKPAQADAEGQLISVDQQRKKITVQDKISEQPVTVALASGTRIMNQGMSGSEANLEPGALVKIHFTEHFTEHGAALPEAESVYILAAPGADYTFYGEVSYIDKAQNIIAIRDPTGDRFYDISVEGAGLPPELHIGSTARVKAQFDGTRYVARSITVEQANSPGTSQPDSQEKESQK